MNLRSICQDDGRTLREPSTGMTSMPKMCVAQCYSRWSWILLEHLHNMELDVVVSDQSAVEQLWQSHRGRAETGAMDRKTKLCAMMNMHRVRLLRRSNRSRRKAILTIPKEWTKSDQLATIKGKSATQRMDLAATPLL